MPSLRDRISFIDSKYRQAKAQKQIEHLGLRARPLWVHIVITTSVVLIVALQGVFMNMFYVNHYDSMFTFMWFVADIATIFVFVGALIVANNYLRYPHRRIRRKILDLPDKTVWHPGILPLSYVSWLFYSAVIVSKILFLVEGGVVFSLRYQKAFFGSVLMQGALLQIAISLSGVVFSLIVEGHCTAPRSSWRYSLEVNDSALIALEVLDTANLIYILACYKEYDWMQTDVTPEITPPIEFVCVTTFVLPSLFLYQLTMTDVQSEIMMNVLTTITDILHIILIDCPNIGIRIYLWTMNDFYSSLYLMRNIFSVYTILRRALPNITEMIIVCRFTAKNPKYSNIVEYTERYNTRKIDALTLAKLEEEMAQLSSSTSTIGSSELPSPPSSPSTSASPFPSLIRADRPRRKMKMGVSFRESKTINKPKRVPRKSFTEYPNKDEPSKQPKKETTSKKQPEKNKKEQPENMRKEKPVKTRKDQTEKTRKELPEMTKKEQPEMTRKESPEMTRKEQSEKTRKEQPEKTRKDQQEKTRKEQPEKTKKDQPEKTRKEQPEKTRKEQPEKMKKEQPEMTRKEESEKKRETSPTTELKGALKTSSSKTKPNTNAPAPKKSKKITTRTENPPT